MNKEQLTAISQDVDKRLKEAKRILDGDGDDYDGADGARYIIDLCNSAMGLIAEIESQSAAIQQLQTVCVDLVQRRIK